MGSVEKEENRDTASCAFPTAHTHKHLLTSRCWWGDAGVIRLIKNIFSWMNSITVSGHH